MLAEAWLADACLGNDTCNADLDVSPKSGARIGLLLSSLCTASKVKDAFDVKDLDRPERSRGFGLVKFSEQEEALYAHALCDRTMLQVQHPHQFATVLPLPQLLLSVTS